MFKSTYEHLTALLLSFVLALGSCFHFAHETREKTRTIMNKKKKSNPGFQSGGYQTRTMIKNRFNGFQTSYLHSQSKTCLAARKQVASQQTNFRHERQ